MMSFGLSAIAATIHQPERGKMKTEDDKFQSEITKRYFGSGLESPNYITRAEAKAYLSQIVSKVSQQNWLQMVTQTFIGELEYWTVDALTRQLNKVKYDIDLVKARVLETAGRIENEVINEN
jgi:hypothetical protein